MEPLWVGIVCGLGLGLGLGMSVIHWWGGAKRRREQEQAEARMQSQIAQLDQTKFAWEQFASHAIPVIQVLTRQITMVIEQTEEAVSDLTVKVRSIAERAQQQAAAAAGSLSGTESPVDLQSQAEGLASDVSRIVMAIQFQDITKQKLEHVAQPLLQMKAYMESLVENSTSPELAASLNLLEEVERSYTMETERTAHRHAIEGRAHVGTSARATVEEEDENVTFF